jgi:osomolarity two-component system response regulator SKN7
MLKFKTLL